MPKSENQVVPNRYSINSETDESDDYDDSEDEVRNLEMSWIHSGVVYNLPLQNLTDFWPPTHLFNVNTVVPNWESTKPILCTVACKETWLFGIFPYKLLIF